MFNTENLMTIREVATELRCCELTARNLALAGHIPAVRRGGPTSPMLVPRRGLQSYLYGPPAREES